MDKQMKVDVAKEIKLSQERFQRELEKVFLWAKGGDGGGEVKGKKRVRKGVKG